MEYLISFTYTKLIMILVMEFIRLIYLDFLRPPKSLTHVVTTMATVVNIKR
jgi:hypothetical protein